MYNQQQDPAAPELVFRRLMRGNETYTENRLLGEQRDSTAKNGQKPYAVIVTCSDSRVPPEHIFSTGVGELFVIRTAGNVVSDFELGSIEYGVLHLGARAVIVMGHSGCGAIAAALEGHADGSIQALIDEIKLGIGTETDPAAAEDRNIAHTISRITESPAIAALLDRGDLAVVGAKYSLSSGRVRLLAPVSGG